MVESPNRVGGGNSALPSQSLQPRPARSGAAGQRGSGREFSPTGPRGMRMLAPDTPVDQLDRSAPRGTYLDILV